MRERIRETLSGSVRAFKVFPSPFATMGAVALAEE